MKQNAGQVERRLLDGCETERMPEKQFSREFRIGSV